MSVTIPKNARESIVIRQRTYEGHTFIDVRLHYPGDDGELRPTRQGVTIALNRAGDLADAIRVVARQGVVDAD